MSQKAYGTITVSDVTDGAAPVSVPYYLASSESTGVTSSTPGWSRTVPQLTNEKRYLWVYYVNRYGQGESEPELLTVSGEVASFYNNGAESPVEDLTIEINPVQAGEGTPAPDNVRPIIGTTAVNIWLSATKPKHYGVIWDREHTQMTRTGDAADITTTVTNFCHRGSVNANYDNPFDSIYPWSGVKLCNIDLDAYLALTEGDDIKDCVVAWEGDANFSYSHAYGVWKYTPEFWGASWTDEETGYRHFDITDAPCGNYVHYPEMINGRWRGVRETLTIGGASKIVLLPKPGMPSVNIASSTNHTYANNAGMTLDSIYSLDGAILMYLVEYANMNCQTAIGNGCASRYRQNEADVFTSATTGDTVVHVLKANASHVVPNAIMDIGTASGGIQVGKYYVVSTATNAGDSTILDVTLDRAVTVTTSHYWSIHGIINVADEAIGSKSGYIGTNGYVDAYYRGEVLWSNMFYYVLGAYRQGHPDHKVWLANSDEEADRYNALNMNAHYNTGITLAQTNGYIKTLKYPATVGKLSAPCFCTAVGGSSATPVGDYFATNATSTADTFVLLVGGSASIGASAGVFCWYWASTASNGNWGIGARPRLKNP